MVIKDLLLGRTLEEAERERQRQLLGSQGLWEKYLSAEEQGYREDIELNLLIERGATLEEQLDFVKAFPVVTDYIGVAETLNAEIDKYNQLLETGVVTEPEEVIEKPREELPLAFPALSVLTEEMFVRGELPEWALTEAEAATASMQQILLSRSMAQVFPTEDIAELFTLFGEEPDTFISLLRDKGLTPETKELVQRLDPFLTDQEIEDLISPPGIVVTETTNELFYQVFPKGLNVDAFLDLGKDNPEKLLQLIWMRGDTEESRALIKSLWPTATDTEITSLFTQPTRDFMPEPERDALSELLKSALPKVVTLDTLDKMLEYFSDKPEVLRSNLITVGRNEDTEALVKVLYPSITEQGIDNYFSSEARRVEREALRIAETGEYGTFTAGVGGLISNFGGFFRWLGAEGIGDNLTHAGQFMQVRALPVDPVPFSWEQLFNINSYYAQGFIQSLPTLMLLAVPAVGAYGLAGSVALKVGVGATGRAVLTGIGGAALSRPLESAMEAGSAYDNARAKGMTHQEAKEVANQVFLNNLKLAGLDATQIAAMFLPAGGKVAQSLISKMLVRTITVGGKLFYVGLTEGGEEIYQQILLKQALDEPIEWDAEMQQVFAIGAFSGLAMGVGGDIIVRVQNRVIASFNTEQKAQFDESKATFVTQGMSDDVASQKAIDDVIETNPEVAKTVENVAKQVEAETTLEQITVKDKVEQSVIDNLKQKMADEGKISPEVVPAVPAEVTPAPEVRPTKALSKDAKDLLSSWLGTQPAKGQEIAQFRRSVPNTFAANLENELLATGLIELVNEGQSLRVKPSMVSEANLVAKGKPAIRRAEPGMPEAGLQPEMFGAPPTEFRPAGRGRVVQISMEDQLKLEQARRAAEEAPAETREAYEAQAEIEGLRITHETDPVAQARFKLGGKNVDLTAFISIREQTFPEYFTVKQAEALFPGHDFSLYSRKGTKEYNHVPRDVALDDLTKKFNMTPDEIADRVMGIRKERQQIKQLESDIKTQMTEKPLQALANPTAEDIALTPVGEKVLTAAQRTKTLALFGKYVESETALDAFELTRELRRETRAGRFENLKARAQELIIAKGLPAEESMKQAIRETLAGELPVVETDYLSDLTDKMRDVLFREVAIKMRDYPSEMASTYTALTNALTGKAIPREKGTGSILFPSGGSAWDRLNYVFGEQPAVLKALDKMAKEGKPLKDVVEGIYHETGRAPIPIDQKMADYLLSIPVKPVGQARLGEIYIPAKISETKTAKQIAQETLVLRIELAKPPEVITPPAYFETPIEDAFRQGQMWTSGEKQMLVRVLKEIGWAPIDIGNLIRATKATLDNSFLRQAKVLASGHPLVGFQAHTTAWQNMFSQKHAEAEWQLITRDPDFELYEQIRLDREADPLRIPAFAMGKGTQQWRSAEEYGFPTVERFIPRITGKMPHIRPFERAFTGGTNKVVWPLWKQKLKLERRYAERVATGEVILKEGEAVDIVKEMGDFQQFLANAIQRGNLGKFREAAPLFSGVFFAARSKLGRFFFPSHLLGIVFRKGKPGFNPGVMKEAWRDFLMMNALFGGLMFLGEWLGIWDLEKDPRNAEFMSARIGNMRIDPWAGYRQFVVLYARLTTGTGISSVTGAEYEVNKLGALQNFITGSLSPAMSILLDFWTGRNFLGQVVQVTNARQWLERILPFLVVDIWEAAEEDWRLGALAVVPAIYGEGVQTYTGDWEDNFTKLGLPKYLENTAYGIMEPYYDGKDFWKDTASQFKGVDPETLTLKKGFPAYIMAMAEAFQVREQTDLMPNVKLIAINADPMKGGVKTQTFVDFYKIWQDRQKLVEAGDKAVWTDEELQPDGKYKKVTYKGKEALIAFDNKEGQKPAQSRLGNISQTQYALLMEYWGITDKQKQADFLKAHPELEMNPYDEWYKSHPRENAILAVHGQMDVLTQQAYDLAIQMAKDWDYPDSAVADYLPPKDIAKTHFERIDIVEKWGANSWEDKLLRASSAGGKWVEWYNKANPDKALDKITTPIASLELKVKWHETYKEYDALETDEERAQFKLDNPEWVDDLRRIEAIENNGLDYQDEWVARGDIVDEFGAGSSEAKVWLLDNSEVHRWALDQGLLTDDGSDWKPQVLRINVEWAEKDEEYNGLPEEERQSYLEKNRDYAIARRKRDAYEINFPEPLVPQYVEYYTALPTKSGDSFFVKYPTETFYGDDWWLQAHPDFVWAMVKAGVWKEEPDFSKVPSREVFDLYKQWKDLPLGTARRAFEKNHPDLDMWLHIAKGTALEK